MLQSGRGESDKRAGGLTPAGAGSPGDRGHAGGDRAREARPCLHVQGRPVEVSRGADGGQVVAVAIAHLRHGRGDAGHTRRVVTRGIPSSDVILLAHPRDSLVRGPHPAFSRREQRAVSFVGCRAGTPRSRSQNHPSATLAASRRRAAPPCSEGIGRGGHLPSERRTTPPQERTTPPMPPRAKAARGEVRAHHPPHARCRRSMRQPHGDPRGQE